MNRSSCTALVSLVAGATLFLLVPTLVERDSHADLPYALWRNGVIVHIRNCTAEKTNATLLQCAGLHCAQKVTKILTNAQQANLTINTLYKDSNTGDFIVRGHIAQYLNNATLPNGFSCRMRSYKTGKPKLTTPKNT